MYVKVIHRLHFFSILTSALHGPSAIAELLAVISLTLILQ